MPLVHRLHTPLSYRGRQWEEIAIRRPTPVEVVRYWNANTVTAVMNYLAATTGIPRRALGSMDGTDFNAVTALLTAQIEGGGHGE